MTSTSPGTVKLAPKSWRSVRWAYCLACRMQAASRSKTDPGCLPYRTWPAAARRLGPQVGHDHPHAPDAELAADDPPAVGIQLQQHTRPATARRVAAVFLNEPAVAKLVHQIGDGGRVGPVVPARSARDRGEPTTAAATGSSG